MFKKSCMLLLAVITVLAVSACGTRDKETVNAAETGTEQSTTISGGWELYKNEACALPEEVQAAFDTSIKQLTGNDLKPVAYIARQVVSGTNYMILCESETVTAVPEQSYQMVVVYSDLQGNAEITQMNEFDLTAYVDGVGEENYAEMSAGGWEVIADNPAVVIPQEAKEAFDKAVAELDGNELEPMVLLGTQVVAGTNYAFLCHSTLQTEEAIGSIQVVTVYADLEGNAAITNISTVNPADFNE